MHHKQTGRVESYSEHGYYGLDLFDLSSKTNLNYVLQHNYRSCFINTYVRSDNCLQTCRKDQSHQNIVFCHCLGTIHVQNRITMVLILAQQPNILFNIFVAPIATHGQSHSNELTLQGMYSGVISPVQKREVPHTKREKEEREKCRIVINILFGAEERYFIQQHFLHCGDTIFFKAKILSIIYGHITYHLTIRCYLDCSQTNLYISLSIILFMADMK